MNHEALQAPADRGGSLPHEFFIGFLHKMQDVL